MVKYIHENSYSSDAKKWRSFLLCQQMTNYIDPHNEESLLYCWIGVEIASIHYHKFTYHSRLQTFQPDPTSEEDNIPWNSQEFPSAEDMAKSGFFRIKPYKNQHAACFHCGVVLSDWSQATSSSEGHETFRPQCAFVLLGKLLAGQTFPEGFPNLISRRMSRLLPCYQWCRRDSDNEIRHWIGDAQSTQIDDKCITLALCRMLFCKWSNSRDRIADEEWKPELHLGQVLYSDLDSHNNFHSFCTLMKNLNDNWPNKWMSRIHEYLGNHLLSSSSETAGSQ